MKTINTGGTAFPMQDPQAIHAYAAGQTARLEDPSERDRRYLEARAEAVGGMTLRDYFAAKAMQAYIGSFPGLSPDWRDVDQWAPDRAYEVADAMLVAREKGGAT